VEVLYVSHNMNTIRRLCDRCIVIDEGKVIFDGDVEKGIAIYMNESGNDDYPIFYDFISQKRYYHFGRKLFIYHFLFLEKRSAVYSAKERLHFQIKLKSSCDFDELRILLVLRNSEQVILGIMLSDEFSVKAHEEKQLSGEADIGMLGKGDYSFGLEVTEINKNGAFRSHDAPLVNIK